MAEFSLTQVINRVFDSVLNVLKVRVENSADLLSGLQIPVHDAGSAAYPSSTQEVYTFTLEGNTVGTLTINYTNASKKFIADWELT